MSTDDKYGIGAGLLALGLAAGVILLGQVTYDKQTEDALAKSAVAAADSGKTDATPVVKPSLLYRIVPHREPNRAEEIFDGIICFLALPSGIFFFAMALLSGTTEKTSNGEGSQK